MDHLVVFVGERPLGALLLRHVVLEGCQPLPQLALVERDVGRGAPKRSHGHLAPGNKHLQF